MSSALKRFLLIIIAMAMVITIVISVFFGYIPEKYNYEVGSVAFSDIYAPRDVVDNRYVSYTLLYYKFSTLYI